MDIVSAISKVLAVGLILGAGLPALFALGMRAEAVGNGELDGRPANPVMRYLGYALIGVTLLVIVIGILWVTRQTIFYYFDIKIFPDFAYKK